MNKGFCHECNKEFHCSKELEVAKDVYECPYCDYPNHINQLCPTKWKIVMKDG